MTSTYSRKRDGRQYRYYVSQSVLKKKNAAGIEIPRLAAEPLEKVIKYHITEAVMNRTSALVWHKHIDKVTITGQAIIVKTQGLSACDEPDDDIIIKVMLSKTQ